MRDKILLSIGVTLMAFNESAYAKAKSPFTTVKVVNIKSVSKSLVSLPTPKIDMQVQSNTISVGPIAVNYCAGSIVAVPLSIYGTFKSGNIFTVQLSNATGSFNNPQKIGFVTGGNVSAVNATIPLSTLSGSGYRIRIVASNPVTIGSDNGHNIEIVAKPTVNFSGLGSIYCLQSIGVPLIGIPSGGVFSGPGIVNNTFQLASAGIGTHTVTYTYTDPVTGCSGTKKRSVTVNAPFSAFVNTSFDSITLGQSVTLKASSSTGSKKSYQWIGPNLLTDTGSTVIANPEVPATYTVIASRGRCSSTTTVKIFVKGGEPMVGTYTINSNLITSGRNYQTFSRATNDLIKRGISGTVNFNVVPGSGPYNEQVNLSYVQGMSNNSRVIFNGNGCSIKAAPSVSNPAVFTLLGIDYVRINNLNVGILSGASAGWGIWLRGEADDLTISNCTIVTPDTSSQNYAGIVASNSAQINSTGKTTNHSFISNNTIIGGLYGIRINGDMLGDGAENNQISGNIINGFDQYGIYLTNTKNIVIDRNDISRPNGTAVFYGVYIGPGVKSSLISRNQIHDVSSATAYADAYGIFASGANTASGLENKIANNLIYNFKGQGNAFGISNMASSGFWCYHNTISIDNIGRSNTQAAGFYQTNKVSNVIFKNNVISLTRGGTGKGYGIWFYSTISDVQSDYNVIHLSGDSTLSTGRLGMSIYKNLSNWQTAKNASFDSHSCDADPMFEDVYSGNFLPFNSSAQDFALPIPWVSLDIMGNMRSLFAVDPGAYEGLSSRFMEPGNGKEQNFPVKEENLLKAWPVPFNNELNVSVQEDNARTIKVILTDMMGRIIEQKIGAGRLVFQTEDLPAGVYLLQTTNGDCLRVVKK